VIINGCFTARINWLQINLINWLQINLITGKINYWYPKTSQSAGFERVLNLHTKMLLFPVTAEMHFGAWELSKRNVTTQDIITGMTTGVER
jgi:hypothetical protein